MTAEVSPLSVAERYIFVTGGVVSSLGKGVSTGVITALLEARGLRVSPLKMDPYLNIDPGTMNPYQHGEVYVTCDGRETDLDVGHYERFSDHTVLGANSVTAGQVYNQVLSNERKGSYQGATVQVIPHITDEIIRRILAAGEEADVVLVEVGGTVGDIESQPFLEAIRQLRATLPNPSLLIHLTLVPQVGEEVKTKPTQHSVRELRTAGLQPDILLCRSQAPVDNLDREKISLFCSVPTQGVFSVPNVQDIYHLPHRLHVQNLDQLICQKLDLQPPQANLASWQKYEQNSTNLSRNARVAIVGKYVSLKDSYKSLTEAIRHAGMAVGASIDLTYLDADILESDESTLEHLSQANAVIIPGGFGTRGTEGMIRAAKYCRSHDIPLLGICLGLHIMVVEAARNLAKLSGALSSEVRTDTEYPVISLVTEWTSADGNKQSRSLQSLRGGTMRLGDQKCSLTEDSLVADIYGAKEIIERHRHRYEITPRYVPQLEAAGFKVSGVSSDGLVEIMELPQEDHPFYLGCQFHPEFTSTPRRSHKLFKHFISKALELAEK